MISIDSITICGRSSAWPTSNISRSLTRPPGPMPMMKRPPQSWSNIAAWAATVAGCIWGRLMTPVPNTIRVVRGIRLAKKMRGEVMRSLHELKCSPTKASVKPSRSARTMASWSSARICPYSRSGWWNGIVNRPSLTLTGDLLDGRAFAGARSRGGGDRSRDRLDDAACVQARELRGIETEELAEHAVGVLAEERRGPRDTTGGAAVQANGGVRHEGLAPPRVIDLRPVPALAQVRVRHHLGGGAHGRARHVGEREL